MSDIQIFLLSCSGAWIIGIPVMAFVMGRSIKDPQLERTAYIVGAILWPIMFVGMIGMSLWDVVNWAFERGRREGGA